MERCRRRCDLGLNACREWAYVAWALASLLLAVAICGAVAGGLQLALAPEALERCTVPLVQPSPAMQVMLALPPQMRSAAGGVTVRWLAAAAQAAAEAALRGKSWEVSAAPGEAVWGGG